MVIHPRIPIELPDIGAGNQRVRFGQWLVDDGESVLAGDRVAEVITPGVLVYVAAPAEGVLFRGNVSPGTDLTIGTTLGVILTSSDETPAD